MSAFLSPLRVEFLDGDKWRVTEDFGYHLGEPGGEEFVSVPAGFLTDFASIPRVLWPVLPPTGKYGKAAVIHDKLYQEAIIHTQGGTRSCNRGEADGILKEAMEVLGVGRMARWTIYAGVRSGGWLSWKRYRDAEQKTQ